MLRPALYTHQAEAKESDTKCVASSLVFISGCIPSGKQRRQRGQIAPLSNFPSLVRKAGRDESVTGICLAALHI